uniref:DUF4220 domain-containing protein n=1 Tax=Setaria italica TaxID=4555 RepID=K3YCM8_SETIT
MEILVLLSLKLQVVLLLLAGIRRRQASRVLTFILWVAYQLADSTAIYALGHLFLSNAARDHQLVAFWAPFLLLHLGGPDNITAYALQDNELWLRHLLTLIVQVLGAAYVLYKHIAGNGSMIVLAAILMFTVGVVKYGERTWALRCGNMDSIRRALKQQTPPRHNHIHRHDQWLDEEELQVRRAHSQFHICKRAIVDSSDDIDSHDTAGTTELLGTANQETWYQERESHMWTMMEMELSLMYDILYTKAAVIHTWFGYCVRLVSPIVAASSLLLFHLSGKEGHSRVDVAVTYVLLAGALLLESISLLSALGSTWTFAFLYATSWTWLRYTFLCSGKWDQLRHAVVYLRRLVKMITGGRSSRSARRWSGAMGQYNMLHFCTRNRPTRSLFGMLAVMLGSKELWDKKHYSGTDQISDMIKKVVNKYIHRLHEMGRFNALGVLRKKWSQEALERWKLYERVREYIGVELQEGVIIWHIATDIFLACSAAERGLEEVKAVRAMSNYMMFLLVDRPEMLPGLAQTRLYERTCMNLVEIWENAEHPTPRHGGNTFTTLFRLRDDPNSYSRMEEIEKLASILRGRDPNFSNKAPRLSYATIIANILLEKETSSSLQLLLEVWTDILVYAGNRCSRESHAKKLNDGGELITILWLMIEHLHQASLD